MSNKSANLCIRIEPEVKDKAEAILSELGIPASNAINIFYKQIIIQNGLPFDVKLSSKIIDESKITEEELSQELKKSYLDVMNGGKTYTVNESMERLNRKKNGI
ncbi:MAG: type II toxin-antitoxin system RelB/DinJ family antitoxin [bacterium]|nr:type II toxin-antitoxin system RelB/DinJ family antitoxin [bacterium]